MSRTVQLSILDRIEVASPCPAAWEDMRGDERSRFCGECRLNVYNIAAMSRQEAEALILAKEGRLCARIYRRTDGTILTSDCPVGLRAVRMKLAAGLARVGAAAALAIGTMLTIAGARGAGTRARDVQPFATICNWLSPPVTPVPTAGLIVGKIAAPSPGFGAPTPGVR